MEINLPSQLLNLNPGQLIHKGGLSSLIINSKKPESYSYQEEKFKINNTPQQGINWIGPFPDSVKAVILKVYHKGYESDGWQNPEKTIFHYAFKARKGIIKKSEKANSVIINQPIYGYPLLLFIEKSDYWEFNGTFRLSETTEKYAILENEFNFSQPEKVDSDFFVEEGQKRLIKHETVERNRSIVRFLKANRENVCEICAINFSKVYGISYIEAHHKIPLSSLISPSRVRAEDFALLCPNCHKATHLLMDSGFGEWEKIKTYLKEKIRG